MNEVHTITKIGGEVVDLHTSYFEFVIEPADTRSASFHLTPSVPISHHFENVFCCTYYRSTSLPRAQVGVSIPSPNYSQAEPFPSHVRRQNTFTASPKVQGRRARMWSSGETKSSTVMRFWTGNNNRLLRELRPMATQDPCTLPLAPRRSDA